MIDAAKGKAKGKGKKGKKGEGKGKTKAKDKGKTKNKNPSTSEAGYEPESGAYEYAAESFFTTMLNMDEMDDQVPDTGARPADWT
eukprot:6471346-Amphidinium_carterae.1